MPQAAPSRLQPFLVPALGLVLCAFTLAEVNYPVLAPQTQLAVFSLIGLILCFLTIPARAGWEGRRAARLADGLLVALSLAVWGYIIVHSEPVFSAWWRDGQSLGNRAGQETALDAAVGVVGTLLVLEAARRSLGLALPLLSAAFLIYAYAGPSLPDWLLPHRGYGLTRITAQAFLHSQGVFGVALNVMFTYVFLFVLLGVFLERTGATSFIIDLARRLFARSVGGPAKVSVLSSGLMGSLSGSAVANTVTTGTFTIPLMRSSGFTPATAAAVEAAASSGGALMPPVMGAGAYMMLEIIDPPVTYLQVIRAALLPAIIYYLSLLLVVHFRAQRRGLAAADQGERPRLSPPAGVVFTAAFAALLLFLLMGYTAFRAVTLALASGALASLCFSSTRVGGKGFLEVAAKAARDVVPLIAAAACVGLVLGVVTLTGVGTRFPALLLPLAEQNLPLALFLLMISSLVLGMGLPSAVCYLLLATLVGPVLGQLGVVPLAAHLFIFYFGMMSMVTPPVALAGYAAASIAGSDIMRTSMAAFRMALVGFTLPYMFVFRPQLLMLEPGGGPAPPLHIAGAVFIAVLGIIPFAAAIAGRLFTNLGLLMRALLLSASMLLLLPGPHMLVAGLDVPLFDASGAVVFAALAMVDWRRSRQAPAAAPTGGTGGGPAGPARERPAP